MEEDHKMSNGDLYANMQKLLDERAQIIDDQNTAIKNYKAEIKRLQTANLVSSIKLQRDLKLAELSEDQVRTLALAVINMREDLQLHITKLSQYGDMQAMFSTKILEYQTEVDTLIGIEGRLIKCLADKTIERKIASN